MATNDYRRPSNAPLWAMFILVGIGLAAFLWTIRMDLPQPATILLATPEPQAPGVKPGSGVITGITLPTLAPARVPATAPLVVPTSYTQADAEATSVAAYNAAVAEMQSQFEWAPASKEVANPADAPAGINADWCRGSHLSRPECQPSNGSKAEK